MIVTRTPLRISFVGGGSDIPSYYRHSAGAVVSATIDKYIYITVNRKFDPSIRLCYSQTENVERVDDLQHDLARACLRRAGIADHIEIHSCADIPAGTGLGSSSAYTVGLLHALAIYKDKEQDVPQWWLADQACKVEIGDCGHPIGKQDQYAAAFGGLRIYRFLENDTVANTLLNVDITRFESHLLLLYTGQTRDANGVLAQQATAMDDSRARTRVASLVIMAHEFTTCLETQAWRECGAVLDDAWSIKRRLASGITTAQIDDWYTAARKAGAWGGKLLGAGGGGFLLFLAPPDRHAAIAAATGLCAVPFALTSEGSTVVYRDTEQK